MENMWSSYPRPQMVKDKYCSLNGCWKLNGKDIIVPFPPQSEISGYNYNGEEDLVYERTFEVPENFYKERILLHFGAVDQITEVFINGFSVGNHEGGYLPFWFDITEYTDIEGENKLTVKVKDELSLDLPYGKQSKKRGGMWYTPVSGIWQSVWLENVPEKFVESLVIKPSLTNVNIEIKGNVEGFVVEFYKKPIKDNFDEIYFCEKYKNNEKVRFEFGGNIGNILCEEGLSKWSPDEPYLYIMEIITAHECIKTYVALREIAIKEINGINRVCLNNEPIFMHGVLDQGYFKKGIYLPKDEKSYDKDIWAMKELGFNMLRKHIKIEPEYFYYACDRLGMLVMQDMVNNGKYSFIFDTALPTIGFKKKSDRYKVKKKNQKDKFINHTKQTISHLYNHPSIVAYTIFNEGWGQIDSDEIYHMVKTLDDTRLVDSTSGWYAQKYSDFDSEHIYFKIKEMRPKVRPLLISECGGYQMAVTGHLFSDKEYGYGKCNSKEELTRKITDMYEGMVLPGIEKGVCGCVYTQLSDVEDEINGLYTYDREVCKVIKEYMINIADKMYKKLK